MDRFFLAVLRWIGRNWMTTVAGLAMLLAYFSPETLKRICEKVFQSMVNLVIIVLGTAGSAVNQNTELIGGLMLIVILYFILRNMIRSLFGGNSKKK